MDKMMDQFKGYFFIAENEEEKKSKVMILESEKKGTIGFVTGPHGEIKEEFLKKIESGGCLHKLCSGNSWCRSIFHLIFGKVDKHPFEKEKIVAIYRCQCDACEGSRLSGMIKNEGAGHPIEDIHFGE